jgi:glycosyltransferase involved in cell wall biosynthesis
MVCLEAMAAERAVIATRGGGSTEIVVDRETGLLVEPGDVDGLACAMTSLAADPALAARFGMNGRARALRLFTWERTVQSYLEAYALARGVALMAGA